MTTREVLIVATAIFAANTVVPVVAVVFLMTTTVPTIVGVIIVAIAGVEGNESGVGVGGVSAGEESSGGRDPGLVRLLRLLDEKERMSPDKAEKGIGHGDEGVGHNVFVLEAANYVEDEGFVGDKVADVTKSVGECLQLVAIGGDEHVTLDNAV